MDKNSLKNLNFLTVSDLKMVEQKRDIGKLEEALSYLRKGERMSECHAHEIFYVILTDFQVLQNAFKEALGTETDVEIRSILQEVSNEVDQYFQKVLELQEAFQPYLYCPALEEKRA